MMGYGDRTSWSQGVHDPLYAYLLYVKDGDQGDEHVWIIPDLCLFSLETSLSLRKKLSEAAGLEYQQIGISATHTHSGPYVRYLAETSEPWEKRYWVLLIDQLAEAVQEARKQAFPGVIDVRIGSMEFGVNRRGKGRKADPRLVLLSLKDESDVCRGHLFVYSCHLTALGVDNYLISSDWVGPVREYWEDKLSVPVGFIQGAEGNVDPVCRGVLHMEDPDQAKGVSFEEMEETAQIAVKAFGETLSGDPAAVLSSLKVSSYQVDLPLRFGAMSTEQIEQKIDEWKQAFAEFLDIPVSEVPDDYTINALIKERCRAIGSDDAEVLTWVSRQFTYCGFLAIYRNPSQFSDPSRGVMACPLVLWDFGALCFLGIPFEVLVENALHFQKRNPDSIALIASLFNGWLGYLPHKDNFLEPDQHELYETVSTMTSETAGDVILDRTEEVRSC